VRCSSSRVTTVTVANWSATIGSQPGGSSAGRKRRLTAGGRGGAARTIGSGR
jgi:hypothetical protein